MKVALAAEGTRGDIYPVLALARTLQAAGHGVRLCVPPDFETEARATGAEFVSLRTEVRSFIQEGARAVHGGGPAMAREMLRWGSQALANQFAVLPEAVEGCGYVFGAGTILAGASAAELHRIPYSPILFTPAILPSGSTTPAVLPFQLRSPRWNRLLWSVVTKGLNWALRRPVGRERARLGLPHISDLLTHVISPRPIMA
ncbi:MAG: glycosyltransferase, partial [Acidobacteriota bacterium]